MKMGVSKIIKDPLVSELKFTIAGPQLGDIYETVKETLRVTIFGFGHLKNSSISTETFT